MAQNNLSLAPIKKKNKICKYFGTKLGPCKKGDKCMYLHLKNGYVHNTKLDTFAYLERIAPGGKKALQGKGGIILQKGTYSVSKFVHNIDPVYQQLPVTWIPKDENISIYKSSTLHINDPNWDGAIPIMHATRSNVRFYGCYLDPDDNESPLITCNDGGMF